MSFWKQTGVMVGVSCVALASCVTATARANNDVEQEQIMVVVTNALCDSGLEYLTLEKAILNPNPKVMGPAISTALIESGSHFYDASNVLLNMLRDEISVTPELIRNLRMLARTQRVAGFAVAAGHFDTASKAYGYFAIALRDLEEALEYDELIPEAGAYLKLALENARTLEHVFETMHDNGKDSKLREIAELVLEAAETDPETLEWDALDILSIRERWIAIDMGLNDPEMLEILQDIVSVVQAEGAEEMYEQLAINPVEYLQTVSHYGVAGLLVESGQALKTSAEMMLNYEFLGCLSSTGAWADDCASDADCDPWAICGEGIGTGSANPTDLKHIGLSMEILTRAPRLTPGMGKAARKAMKGLIGKLKKARPQAYINISWGKCKDTWCLFGIVTNKECRTCKSGWLEVEEPIIGLWWPSLPWSDNDLESYEEERDELFEQYCKDNSNGQGEEED